MLESKLAISIKISVQHFRRIWQKKFGDVVIPKYHRLGICEVCLRLQAARDNARGPDKAKAAADLQAHYDFVDDQKNYHILSKEEARERPDIMSLSIDGSIFLFSYLLQGWIRPKQGFHAMHVQARMIHSQTSKLLV